MAWWNWSNNAVDADSIKKPKGKGVVLTLSDKHEPFGSLSIDKIKRILEEEDFAEMQSLFFYMLRDLKIASVVLARRQPLLSLTQTIESENKAFTEWLNDSSIDLDELITQLSYSVYYGVALSDIEYTIEDGKLVPVFSVVSPRFIHAHKDKLLKKTVEHLYIKQGNNKKTFINKLDPDRVVFHKHAVDIGEITDFSLASKLVWYFSLKHIAMAHNLAYFDNVATPPLITKTDADEKDVVDMLYQLKSASVGVFGKDDIVEYLSVQSKADFLNFIEYIDRQIATLVLGNTLSTGEGKTGSFSQAQTHENRQKETLQFDAKLIAKTLSAYLSRLEALNFSQPKGVKFTFPFKEQKDLKDLSIVVKNLSDAGFELDSEDIETQFGLKILGKKQAEQVTQQDNHVGGHGCTCSTCTPNRGVQLNNNTPQYGDHLDSQNPDTKTHEKTLLNSIENALKQVNSFDEAYQILLDLHQDIPLDELEEALFDRVANSQILADAEVNQENA